MAVPELDGFIDAEFAAHAALVTATRDALAAPLLRLVSLAAETVERGGKIFFFGNGGSASDAQHLATELTVRYQQNRLPIPAIALTTDSSALTAIGNDLGFDQLFVRQIRALGRRGDMAIGITTSGKSANVTLGLEAARNVGMLSAALCGKGGGDLKGIADPLLIVPSDDTGRIQEMHITLGQIFCAALERRLGLV